MIRYFFLLVLLSGTTLVHAGEDQPTLVALELPGLTNAFKKGAFSNLYDALQEETLIENWEAAPIFRAHQIFLNKTAACLAPASLRLLDEYGVSHDQVAPLVPFNRVRGYLLTAENYVLEHGEKPSLGVVGVGYLFGVEQEAYQLVNVATYDQLLYLIGANRISAAYINYPDVIHHANAMDFMSKFEGKVELRWDGVDHIMCWKEYASTTNEIANTIKKWELDGSLASMLGKYYIELDDDG